MDAKYIQINHQQSLYLLCIPYPIPDDIDPTMMPYFEHWGKNQPECTPQKQKEAKCPILCLGWRYNQQKVATQIALYNKYDLKFAHTAAAYADHPIIYNYNFFSIFTQEDPLLVFSWFASSLYLYYFFLYQQQMGNSYCKVDLHIINNLIPIPDFTLISAEIIEELKVAVKELMEHETEFLLIYAENPYRKKLDMIWSKHFKQLIQKQKREQN